MRYALVFKGLLVFGAVFMTVRLQAASFDCTKASTPVEKMICADSELSTLDEQLHEHYQKAIAPVPEPDKTGFKKIQRAWLKEKRNSCGDADCLRAEYQERIKFWEVLIGPHGQQTASEGMAQTESSKVITYADIRTDVTVEKLPKQPAWEKPRPANFFQLAGSANKELCDATLAAFNEQAGEPPKYYSDISSRSGEDSVHWLLYNAHEVQFESLEPGKPSYSFGGLEYARIDLDGDDKPEHVYRRNGILSSNYHQELMIVSEPFQDRPDLLKKFEDTCLEVYPRGDFCRETYNQIRYAFNRSYPEKKLIEWAFTRGDSALAVATSSDPASSRYVDKRLENGKNIPSSNSAYWSLHKIGSQIVAVSAPILDYSPPQLLVFLPSQDQPGHLQCILMPRVWHKFFKFKQ